MSPQPGQDCEMRQSEHAILPKVHIKRSAPWHLRVLVSGHRSWNCAGRGCSACLASGHLSHERGRLESGRLGTGSAPLGTSTMTRTIRKSPLRRDFASKAAEGVKRGLVLLFGVLSLVASPRTSCHGLPGAAFEVRVGPCGTFHPMPLVITLRLLFSSQWHQIAVRGQQ